MPSLSGTPRICTTDSSLQVWGNGKFNMRVVCWFTFLLERKHVFLVLLFLYLMCSGGNQKSGPEAALLRDHSPPLAFKELSTYQFCFLLHDLVVEPLIFGAQSFVWVSGSNEVLSLLFSSQTKEKKPREKGVPSLDRSTCSSHQYRGPTPEIRARSTICSPCREAPIMPKWGHYPSPLRQNCALFPAVSLWSPMFVLAWNNKTVSLSLGPGFFSSWLGGGACYHRLNINTEHLIFPEGVDAWQLLWTSKREGREERNHFVRREQLRICGDGHHNLQSSSPGWVHVWRADSQLGQPL